MNAIPRPAQFPTALRTQELRRAAQPAPDSRVRVARAAGPLRRRYERHVRNVYAAAHGASITAFQPLLLGIETDNADLVGVIGARAAEGEGALFLECYLDLPVEQAVSSQAREVVTRRSIAEVGNLTSEAPGGGRLLVTTLAFYLRELGLLWAVFTATRELRNGFARLGIELLDLGPARPERVGADLGSWGAYYTTEPHVSAARLSQVAAACTADPRLVGRYGHVWRRARIAAHGVGEARRVAS